jgi:hypothetical protein
MAPPQPFDPATNGFAFTNSWPQEPAVSVATAFGPINIGNAAAGLCGGMVFAALDYWYAGQAAPSDQPGPGTPLYKFLVKRIIDSWHVPTGVAQYYQWMNLPDADAGFTAFGHHVVVERGLASRPIQQQWPLIRADLDRGLPSALGLVTIASHSPADLGHNHQVLASGYDVDGSSVSVRVYDPNSGQDDGVTISFDTSAPTKATKFVSNVNIGRPIRGFFRTSYSPVKPPAA